MALLKCGPDRRKVLQAVKDKLSALHHQVFSSTVRRMILFFRGRVALKICTRIVSLTCNDSVFGLGQDECALHIQESHLGLRNHGIYHQSQPRQALSGLKYLEAEQPSKVLKYSMQNQWSLLIAPLEEEVCTWMALVEKLEM